MPPCGRSTTSAWPSPGQADPQQTIAAILDRARDLLAMDAALLAVDGPGGELRLVALERRSGSPARRPAGQRPDARGLRRRRSRRATCSAAARFASRRRSCSATSGLGLWAWPLAALRRFSETEVGTLSALATQVGLALEAARLQDELQALAVQGERERIAREMHDGLAQVLGYVNTKSQAVDEMLADGRVAEARQQLGELAAAARSLYVDVREAILSLSSPVPPERGLAAALEEYAALYAESSKLAVRFEATPEASRRAALGRRPGRGVPDRPRGAHQRSKACPGPARRPVAGASGPRGRPSHRRRRRRFRGGACWPGARNDGRTSAWPACENEPSRSAAASPGSSRPGAGTTIELRVPVGAVAPRRPRPMVSPRLTERGGPQRQHQAVRSPVLTDSEAD